VPLALTYLPTTCFVRETLSIFAGGKGARVLIERMSDKVRERLNSCSIKLFVRSGRLGRIICNVYNNQDDWNNSIIPGAA
jgi:hypothetical protein